jgi:hypothetical protein
LYQKKQDRPFNDAIPPSTLFANLQPREDWLATSACLSELGGAHVNIPVQAELDNEMTTEPGPQLRLTLDGRRKVIFSDQQAANRISVWNEWVTSKGKLYKAEQQSHVARPLLVTNPPAPAPRTIANIPDPPEKILPAPPSPLSGQQQ